MVRVLWFGLCVLAWMAAPPAAAKPQLFSDDAPPLNIVITAPFPALVRAAPTSTNPYPATLSVSDGAGPAQTFAIQLSARGHSRRTTAYCAFPPLWLKFDKAAVKGTLFHGQHKLKLTTYCRGAPDYQPHIVLEYLAYRFYNLMTPMSFRARAAEVTYKNADGRGDAVTRFGFLIEDIDDVAARNDRDRLRAMTHQVKATQLDAHATARAALFEYMIGNLDWEFLASSPGEECCHNVRLIAARGAAPATATAVVPVPYDYDSTGLVDPPYAGPPEGFPIDRLTDRFYRGYCVSSGEIASVAEEFRAHRAQMMALIDNEPKLGQAFRTKTDRFMDGFFAVLDDPARLGREVVRHCR